jgi:hypothetical protein
MTFATHQTVWQIVVDAWTPPSTLQTSPAYAGAFLTPVVSFDYLVGSSDGGMVIPIASNRVGCFDRQVIALAENGRQVWRILNESI